jgi:hypothetical protein
MAICAGLVWEHEKLEQKYLSNVSDVFEIQSKVSYWSLIILIPDAVQEFFISLSLLMVLDRLIHVAFSSAKGLSENWVFAERLSVMVVICLSIASVLSCVASSVYIAEKIPLDRKFSSAVRLNMSASRQTISQQLQKIHSKLDFTESISDICESVALVYMIFCFVSVFCFCYRRIEFINEQAFSRSRARQLANQTRELSEKSPQGNGSTPDSVALKTDTCLSSNTESSIRISCNTLKIVEQMKQVRRQIVVTVLVVFAALIVVAVVLILDAASGIEANDDECGDDAWSFFQNEDPDVRVCLPCSNVNLLIQDWMEVAPHFLVLTTCFPLPLALMVALWGMTSPLMRKILFSSRWANNDFDEPVVS